MSIADRIQHLRKTKGLSQEELADKLGVSRQAVSKWESEQSIPDIDKIIGMSDFFGVTTDYILKGIEAAETEKQSPQKISAMIFLWVATAMNFMGLIISCAVWYEEQSSIALAIGLIIMAGGCMIFGIGQSVSTANTEKAKRNFWTLNIWLLAFVALSVVYNALLSYPLAPYPLIFGPYYALQLPVFWLIYITICTAVALFQVKKLRRQ